MFIKNTISLEEDDDFSYLNEDFPSQFIFIGGRRCFIL